MIVCNGLPKSGTHALMRIVAASGYQRIPGLLDGMRGPLKLRGTKPYPVSPALSDVRDKPGAFVHGHIPSRHAEKLSDCLVITVTRDPRDVAVSYSRWRKVSLEKAILNFFKRPLAEWYREFSGWDNHGIVVQYNDIKTYAQTLPGGLYKGAQINHDTWTGKPSDWREHWNDRIDRLWHETGGHELT